MVWGSNKLKEVASEAAEAMAMLEAIEEARWCRSLLDDVIGKGKAGLPIIVVTRFQSVDSAIQSINIIKDEPHWIDGTALKREVERGQILVARQAEAGTIMAPFIKKDVNTKSLRAVLETGHNKGVSLKIFGMGLKQ